MINESLIERPFSTVSYVLLERRGSMNAIALLTQEHEKLRPFLHSIAEACSEKNTGALNQALDAAQRTLSVDLDHHIGLEDTVVFPRFAQSIGAEMVEVFIDDHREIQSMRDRLYSADTSERHSLALALEEMLQEHMDREEHMLFPAATNEMKRELLELESD